MLGVGANHSQAFPTLTSATNSSTSTTVQGTLSSAQYHVRSGQDSVFLIKMRAVAEQRREGSDPTNDRSWRPTKALLRLPDRSTVGGHRVANLKEPWLSWPSR